MIQAPPKQKSIIPPKRAVVSPAANSAEVNAFFDAALAILNRVAQAPQTK